MGLLGYIIGVNILPIVLVLSFIIYFFKGKREYDKSEYRKENKKPHHSVVKDKGAYGECDKTEYEKQNKKSYFSVVKDKGAYGEYLIYKNLKNLEGEKRWLFNAYLPTNNDRTTEVDVILIHTSGIYVFESKNYSGWIFGNEKQKMWTQSLRAGRRKSQKNKFLNPIIQNKLHIKYLKEQLNDFTDIPFYSFIVFSERCQLKNVSVYDKEITVIKRNKVLSAVDKIAVGKDAITKDKINEIYEKLIIFTNVSEELKQKHIDNIHKDIKKLKCQEMPQQEDINYKVLEEAAKDITKEECFKEFEAEVKEKICPKCGGKMVIRTSTRGEYKGQNFWGCSTFPKCRYIEKIVG